MPVNEKVAIKAAVGMTVKLKSGGPTMTISKIKDIEDDRRICTCHWFVDGVAHSGEFLCSLVTVETKNHPDGFLTRR